jgi:glycine/D-amino acid oxidase-like deaminating enzyme
MTSPTPPSGSTRRQVLKTSLLLPALGTAACAVPGPRAERSSHVAVVGAGAFGGWTAWHLLQAGCQVTLVDAWGPGNARASSGGDTRVLRHAYGDDRFLLDLAARSLTLFQQAQQRWDRLLFERTGLLWLVGDDDVFERASLPHLEAAGVAHEVLTPGDVEARYPQVTTDGVRWALTERDAGILYARRSCEAVHDAFVAEGGRVRRAHARPGPMVGGRMDGLRLSDGSTLRADATVFACGPWLGELFGELLSGALVTPTRQEVFTFGTPPGDVAHRPPALPVWADHGERFWYGIPGNERRGFKIADDTLGDPFDPTDGDRTPSAAAQAAARDHVARRFPALADAPLLEARVCQYENSPDRAFLLDRHPEADDVWIVGGGSGHGFKHGPGFGELAAACVLGQRPREPRFGLARFSG